jgi:CRISPR-associated protein (TIGR02710 family)
MRKGAEVVAQLPNIPTQVNLGNRFNPHEDIITLADPDNLSEAYQLITHKICEIRQTHPAGVIYADYTGGTKTMSLALGTAALDRGLTLYLTTSAVRENLFRVERGQSTSRALTSPVTIERTLTQELPRFLEQYNYSGAIAALTALLANYELTPDQRRRIQELRDLCAGFDAWDRFDHLEAWNFLGLQMKRIQAHGLALKRVLSSRAAIDIDFMAPESIPGHGYELVEDLLNNAERRAHQQRYDDAVGRLYRALELLAQIRLQQTYHLQTGDLDLAKLPETLRDNYAHERHPGSGKIQLSLWKSYSLLTQLKDEPLGAQFDQQANALQNALKVRNYSLFAHGFKPITQADYFNTGTILKTFIESGLTFLTQGSRHPSLPQLPAVMG